jgi:hypothetical protein
MRALVIRAACAAALAIGAAIATAPVFAQVPTIDVRATCRAASSVMTMLMGGSSVQNDVEVCLEGENKAHQQIVKDWSTFTSSDRASCVQPRVYLPSYVEWLTCFEMNKVVRQARDQGQGMRGVTNPDGSMNMPVVPWMYRGRRY